MPKPVKIVILLALVLGGADAARDYFTAASAPGSTHRLGENISFWSFVAVAVCLIAYGVYRRLRSRE